MILPLYLRALRLLRSETRLAAVTVVANLALGGWGGSIDNASIPEQMKIDYIRSYALADGSTTVQGPQAGQGDGSAFQTTTSAPAAGSGGTVSPPPVSPPPAEHP